MDFLVICTRRDILAVDDSEAYVAALRVIFPQHPDSRTFGNVSSIWTFLQTFSCYTNIAESMSGPNLLSTKWNLKTQTPHGGQEWRDMENFIEDFSVTTNALGSPKLALESAREALNTILHYPASDFEPAWSSLAQFILTAFPSKHIVPVLTPDEEELKSRLVLGNGASELIDLCIRLAPGSKWRPGPSESQYKEYERSSLNYNRKTCKWQDTSAELMCIVNPCNPTGDFKTVLEMQRFIEEYCSSPGTTVIVDESMQPWYGPRWRSESLTSKSSWIKQLAENEIYVFVLHSWTKLWSCPGLRLGSLIAPTLEMADRLRKVQVPWSVNSVGLAFLNAVVRDTEYLEQTWEVTTVWRKFMIDSLQILHPEWKFYGADFLSFIWIDTSSTHCAEQVVTKCSQLGVPVRWGFHGYNKPTFIRLGVRHPRHLRLMQALSQLWHPEKAVSPEISNVIKYTDVESRVSPRLISSANPCKSSDAHQISSFSLPPTVNGREMRHRAVMNSAFRPGIQAPGQRVAVLPQSPIPVSGPSLHNERQSGNSTSLAKKNVNVFIAPASLYPRIVEAVPRLKFRDQLYLIPAQNGNDQSRRFYSVGDVLPGSELKAVRNVPQTREEEPQSPPHNVHINGLRLSPLKPLRSLTSGGSHSHVMSRSPIGRTTLPCPVQAQKAPVCAIDPLGFTCNMLPLPCAFLQLPWEREKSYVRLMPSVPQAEAETNSHSEGQAIVSTARHLEMHALIVRRMFVERLADSPSVYIIRYVYSPYADNQSRYDQRELDSSQGDEIAHKLFLKSQSYFPAINTVGLGFSVASVSVSRSQSIQSLQMGDPDVSVIYFRLQIDDLPFSRQQLETDWSRRRKELGQNTKAIVIVFDFRFSNFTSEGLFSSQKWDMNVEWTPDYMRRLVHLTAQTHSILDSWLINNLEGRELTIVHLPPMSFARVVDRGVEQTEREMFGYPLLPYEPNQLYRPAKKGPLLWYSEGLLKEEIKSSFVSKKEKWASSEEDANNVGEEFEKIRKALQKIEELSQTAERKEQTDSQRLQKSLLDKVKSQMAETFAVCKNGNLPKSGAQAMNAEGARKAEIPFTDKIHENDDVRGEKETPMRPNIKDRLFAKRPAGVQEAESQRTPISILTSPPKSITLGPTDFKKTQHERSVHHIWGTAREKQQSVAASSTAIGPNKLAIAHRGPPAMVDLCGCVPFVSGSVSSYTPTENESFGGVLGAEASVDTSTSDEAFRKVSDSDATPVIASQLSLYAVGPKSAANENRSNKVMSNMEHKDQKCTSLKSLENNRIKKKARGPQKSKNPSNSSSVLQLEARKLKVEADKRKCHKKDSQWKQKVRLDASQANDGWPSSKKGTICKSFCGGCGTQSRGPETEMCSVESDFTAGQAAEGLEGAMQLTANIDEAIPDSLLWKTAMHVNNAHTSSEQDSSSTYTNIRLPCRPLNSKQVVSLRTVKGTDNIERMTPEGLISSIQPKKGFSKLVFDFKKNSRDSDQPAVSNSTGNQRSQEISKHRKTSKQKTADHLKRRSSDNQSQDGASPLEALKSKSSIASSFSLTSISQEDFSD